MICRYVETNTQAYTQTHRIHSNKHTQIHIFTQKENIPAKDKGCQRYLTPIGHSQIEIL